MPNLIVIMFNLVYLVVHVGFHCKGYVWERVWRFKAKWRVRSFRWQLARSFPTKWSMCPAHDWIAKSQDRMVMAGFRECLASKAFLRDTRETFYFANLSYLIHPISTHTIYTPITHICWVVLFREKALATTFES